MNEFQHRVAEQKRVLPFLEAPDHFVCLEIVLKFSPAPRNAGLPPHRGSLLSFDASFWRRVPLPREAN
jgi:hypothetical protein